MASSSSRTWRYRVFASFHGPDVRKTFLSHLRKQFSCNGITMFDDQGIQRSQIIAPALTQAIRESTISIVVLSKNYASSSWCLNELLEILKCKEEIGQIVMTIFYGIDPSDVRKQIGDFGVAFNETCGRKTEEERRRWSKALNVVGNIAGEHFLSWDSEAEMVEEIARDVSNKLNDTISRDFEDMVGIEAHLRKVQSLLHLDDEDGAMIAGICGPAGIGKTTIARALHSRLASSFQLTCFVENLNGSCNSGLDEYGLKLRLQEQLLSKIFNQNGMRIYHLGAIPDRLCDQKVLIILDDVDDLQQLEALADETSWFGTGSRIIITTEDQELLEQHGINNTYHVDFPTEEEACRIFCRYAFRQTSSPDGFENLVERVTNLCSNLPLGLRVMGSSLCRKKEDEWEGILHRLEKSVDRDIEKVLRVGYDRLHKDDQLLFLLIGCFLNYQKEDSVKSMLDGSNLDVTLGLKTLAFKSLIKISAEGTIVMHKLLQQVGKEAVQTQDHWKRQILIDTDDICDVLETDSAGRSLMGISFDISRILGGVCISVGAFKRMCNLRFLSVYNTRFKRVDVPENMEFPIRLRLLHWEVYPGKCLPHTFCPEHLVELNLINNQLQKLWEGTQPLTNLKKMDLSFSTDLKELPDLSNAKNLERLELNGCMNLVDIHSSIGYLHKLEWLSMFLCLGLQVVPAHINLPSLIHVNIFGCHQLKKIPQISTNSASSLSIQDTMLEYLHWSQICWLNIIGSAGPYPDMVKTVMDQGGYMERLSDCIKDLHKLRILSINGCPKLVSLPELPASLIVLIVHNCESLETVSLPSDIQIMHCSFINCSKLGHETRRVIIQQSLIALLPGKTVPVEFDCRAVGSSLTIHSDFYKFRVCVVVSPKQEMVNHSGKLLCRISINGCSTERSIGISEIRTKHLYINVYDLFYEDGWLELDNEIMFEFCTTSQSIDIIECGVQIWWFEDDRSSEGSYDESSSEQVSETEECIEKEADAAVEEALATGGTKYVAKKADEEEKEVECEREIPSRRCSVVRTQCSRGKETLSKHDKENVTLFFLNTYNNNNNCIWIAGRKEERKE